MISYCLGGVLRRLSKLPASERDKEINALPEACPRADCTTGMGCRAYVASLFGSEAERRQLVSEARYWIEQGYTTARKVDELIERIAARRGRDAAEQLRTVMREQYARRRDWLAGSVR